MPELHETVKFSFPKLLVMFIFVLCANALFAQGDITDGYISDEDLAGMTDGGRLVYWGVKHDDFGNRFDRRHGLISEDGYYDPYVRENIRQIRHDIRMKELKIGLGIVGGIGVIVLIFLLIFPKGNRGISFENQQK